jgi:3-hydroxy-9,10-secoandrosta-1,3,5(10)-triene-9,17-dione monooxygenase
MTDVAPAPAAAAGELVARADALRPMLVAGQAATEARGYYSEEMHEAFRDAGFYRMLVPRRYGGLEVDLPTYYRVIVSVARGCPSSGWMLALGSAHALQLASYWPQQAQDEIFADGHFVASASFSFENARAEPVDGGYRVSGTWHFCSGVPYATHHMPLVPIAGSDERIVAIVPRSDFTMLDNWGDLIGLKGSGSHSVAIEDAFVPADQTIGLDDWFAIGVTTTPGYRLHRNPLYGGAFLAVAIGELNSVQIGAAQGAIDEYERLLARPLRPAGAAEGGRRADDPNYQRLLGLALAHTDAAYSILLRCGELYHVYAREAMEGGEPFDEERTFRIESDSRAWEHASKPGSLTPERSTRVGSEWFRVVLAVRSQAVRQLDAFLGWRAVLRVPSRSKWSSARPEPIATQVSGDSASDTAMPVRFVTSVGRPRRRVPPPASRMPSRAMSPASSGGVSSSVSEIARRTSSIGAWIASRTSSLCSCTSVGRPVTRWRPRTPIVSSCASGAAEPICSLIASAVCEPIASRWESRR